MEGNQPATTPSPAPASRNTAMAVVAYILFFIPLLTSAKNDPFVKFHVKQGLVLFLTGIAVGIVNQIIFYQFWFALGAISWLLNLGLLVLFVIGVINAVNGKEEKLPLIGQFADKFKF